LFNEHFTNVGHDLAHQIPNAKQHFLTAIMNCLGITATELIVKEKNAVKSFIR
jgi:hypothetical protein